MQRLANRDCWLGHQKTENRKRNHIVTFFDWHENYTMAQQIIFLKYTLKFQIRPHGMGRPQAIFAQYISLQRFSL